MTMRSTRAILIPLFLMSASAQSATPQWCQGRITHALVNKDGALQVIPEFRGDWLQLCSITIVQNTISTDACKSWQATVLTAVATNLSVTIHFADAPECVSIPAYGATPAVSYVLIQNP